MNAEMISHQAAAAFDTHSGSILERLLFNARPLVLFVCLLVTLFLGFEATKVKLNASFEQMIPTQQPYIQNYLKHYNLLQGQGNALRIAVKADHGGIVDPHYLGVLRKLNDQVFELPGVNRAFMHSLWTPNTRWIEITPDGLEGGPVIASDYDGSPAALRIVAQNIPRSGEVGELISPDFRSTVIYAPLLETDSLTGKSLDYGKLAREVETLRRQYAAQGVTLYVSGFAMIVGNLINGISKILVFFLLSLTIATAMLFWYTRCLRSTGLVVLASLVAVTCQIGLLPLLGFALTPYSVLVPFLIFAIGMSHGAQKMNGVMQDIGRGNPPLVAARYTFRRLFIAGFAALTCDAVSFGVLLTIHIEAIRQLALTASAGVAILIFTNLIMLPMMLSYTGVNAKAAARSLGRQDTRQNNTAQSDPDRMKSSHFLWRFLDLFTRRRYAGAVLFVACGLGLFGWYAGRNVQVGDLQKGAPEFRANSLYNTDAAYIDSHYATGSDTFVIMADTPPFGCISYKLIAKLDDLSWRLEQLPQVSFARSAGSSARDLTSLLSEGSPKWFDISPYQPDLNEIWQQLPYELTDANCNFTPIYVSLTDHKAATLNAVIATVNNFIANPANQSPDFKISMAGGNAGIEAATNIVIAQANRQMLYLVYAAVIIFCFITFRSWRAVLCAVLPLILTSILAQALMVWLGIGIKVATLPVIALGVGIGVDYALYVLSIVLKHLRAGATLSVAYHRTLLFTGRVVLLTGFTLATGVATWAFAPIKFQADMGVLLAFMFIWNMLGALILLPALATFLLPAKLFENLPAPG